MRRPGILLPALILVAIGASCGGDESGRPGLEVSGPFGERPFKVVWAQDRGAGRDVYALGDALYLMGYDTGDGKGERQILPGPGNYSRPMITPDGDAIVYSDRMGGAVFITGWEGGNFRPIAKGRALDCWQDPGTGRQWIYVGRGGRRHPREHDEIFRVALDDPGLREPVMDGWVVNENNFQLSADGLVASADLGGDGCGLLDLSRSSWERQGGGCWPALAPDNSYRSLRLQRDHRHVLIGEPGGPGGSVNLSAAPQVGGDEIFHPRWSNHPEYLVLSGPYREGSGTNRIRGGGGAVEIHAGRFAADFRRITSWRRVTNNRYADFYPDLWIAPAQP